MADPAMASVTAGPAPVRNDSTALFARIWSKRLPRPTSPRWSWPNQHSWDRYVAAQWWTLRQWLNSHPGDPLTPDVQTFLDDSQREYLTYQRRHLGWGVFVLKPSR